MDSLSSIAEFFADPAHAGVASNTELADLIGESETYVRAEGRRLNVRRLGSTMAWTEDDALALLQGLEEDEPEDADESAEEEDDDPEDDADDESEEEDDPEDDANDESDEEEDAEDDEDEDEDPADFDD